MTSHNSANERGLSFLGEASPDTYPSATSSHPLDSSLDTHPSRPLQPYGTRLMGGQGFAFSNTRSHELIIF